MLMPHEGEVDALEPEDAWLIGITPVREPEPFEFPSVIYADGQW
jgi:hypothetical protein